MNYAALSDAELDHKIAMARLNPMAADPREVEAMQAERAARRAPKPVQSAAPANVESDLDAAATPITPDPVVRPKVIVPPKPSPRDAYRQSLDEAGWEEDEADLIMRREGGLPRAYANTPDPDRERQNAADWHRTEAAHGRREDFWKDAYGHNYTGPVQQGDTVMVDGRELPAVMGSDGLPLGAGTDRQYYRLRDLKAAERAEAEAAASAALRAQREQENATYGHYSLRDDDPNLTPEQRAARESRRSAEGKAKEARAKWRQAQIDNADRPLTPFEQKEKQRRELRSDMARLAGGSQNLNSGNNSFFQALAMLEGVDPSKMDAQQRAMMQMMPMDPMRAQVEARQLDQAARFAGDLVTGALAGQGANGLQREALDAKRSDEAQAYFDLWHSSNVGYWAGPYTYERRNQMVTYLMLRFKLDRPTAEAIADSKPSSVAGPRAAGAPAAPRSPGVPQPPGVTAGGNPMPMTDGGDR